ncbi:hypothetical protein Esti_002767 [Eimeria stiedai]
MLPCLHAFIRCACVFIPKHGRLEWVARRLALSGLLSRREAVAAIEQGAVQVDGRTLTRDVQVCDEAVISYRGRPIPSAAAWPALFGMIKPSRVACKYSLDAQGPTLKTLLAHLSPLNEEQQLANLPRRQSSISNDVRQDDGTASHGAEMHAEDVQKADGRGRGGVGQDNCRPSRNNDSFSDLQTPYHLIPVNNLPLRAEGLVLLTNDGEFAHALRDPANKIVTAYDFRVTGALPSMDVWRQWALGVRAGGVDYGRVWGELLRPCPSGAWIRLKLVEPRGSDFFSLLGSCGLKIRRMRLHSFGPYLSSSVPDGCLLPLQIDKALQPLAPRQRRRLMLVPAEGEVQQAVEAAESLKSVKGGGFAASRLLKQNSVLVK